MITHDIASARRTPEYMAILWRGKIVEAGLRQDLFESENQFVRQFLAGESAGPLGMEYGSTARLRAREPSSREPPSRTLVGG